MVPCGHSRQPLVTCKKLPSLALGNDFRETNAGVARFYSQYGFFFSVSNIHPRHICMAKGPSVTAQRIFEFVNFPMNLHGISNECNLNQISCVPSEYGVSTYS